MNAGISLVVAAIGSLAVVGHGAAQVPAIARAVVVIVDDGRDAGDAIASARLLELLRDEVLAPDDLVAVVTSGTSSVATDMHRAGDRRRLTEAILRIDAASRLAGAARLGGSPVRAAEHQAQVTFSVLADIVDEFSRLPASAKHLVLLTAGATSAAALEAALRVPAQNTAVGLRHILTRIAADANRGGIAVHVLDPGDSTSPQRLRALRR